MNTRYGCAALSPNTKPLICRLKALETLRWPQISLDDGSRTVCWIVEAQQQLRIHLTGISGLNILLLTD